MVLRIRVFHYVVRCKGRFVISQTTQELDSRDRQKDFSFATAQRATMGPNQFPIQYPGCKRLGREFNPHRPISLVRRWILREDTPTLSYKSSWRNEEKKVATSNFNFVARHTKENFIGKKLYKGAYFSGINTFLSFPFQVHQTTSLVVQCHSHSISMIRCQ
jgi:hypothetical protein